MNKTILWITVLALMITCVCAVSTNTSLTLRAVCTDAYGNLCTGTALWTVILPNGTAINNNSAGGTTTIGISNFTINFTEVGTYLVLANFSGRNITHEWNIVSEDYGVTEIKTTNSVINMMGIYIIMAFIVAILAYIGFKMNEEHNIIKWFLILVSLLLLILIVAIARTANTVTSINNLLDTLYYVIIVVVSLILSYTVIYVIYTSLVNAGKIIPKDKKQ